MKKLLFTATMLCGAAWGTAQTDMTYRIVNPSFETGNFDGWTNSGMQTQSNSSFGLKAGNVYVEKWTGTGGTVGSASVMQTLTEMPIGSYTLNVVAQNIQQDTPEAEQTGVSLVANSDQATVTVAGSYSVNTTVTDGSLKIGLLLSSASGNYVCVDNFKLTLDACSEAELGQLIAKAEELTTQKVTTATLTTLNEAIAAAKAHSGDEGRTDVAAKLSDAMHAAVADTQAYAALQSALSVAEPLAEKKMSAAASAALNEAIGEAKAQTGEADVTATTAKLTAATNEAKTSIASYSALQKALDEANDYYTTGPENGAEELKSVIDEAQSAYDAGTADDAQAAALVVALDSALITCRVANGTGAAPVVTSEPFMPIGCNAALGRMTATGSNIIERGYVWATHPNPTVADNRSTKYYSQNGNIYELSPLEAATEYYVRPYALTKSYAVAYGEEKRIFTLPQASNSWWYNNGGSEEQNARINAALEESIDLYNKWTSVKGFHITCSYGAGTPTADCSYGGSMRVGPNASYQRTGTVLHEANHGVGVGTSSRWKNWDGSSLRANGESGEWLGWRAKQMVQFFEHNTTSILNGDGTHMWPYGINGAHEDDNRKISYIANVLITHAVHQDGLAAVSGIGASPAYTFEYEEGKSYFITNENATYNQGGRTYLYETSAGELKWGEASASDLNDDSQFAWQFEYVPAKAYYRIRNAKSGKYFTYSGSSIKTAAKSTPGNSENFQLMIGFPEVTVGIDKTVTKRGYWIQEGSGAFQPYTLAADANSATKGERLGNFSPKAASAQRWLILTAEEAQPMAGASADVYVANLLTLIEGAKELAAVEHKEKSEDATATLQALIAAMEPKAESITGIAEAKEAVAEMEAGIREFLKGTTPAQIEAPYNLTFLITEGDFATTDTWEFNDLAVPTFTDGVAQVCGEKLKMQQTLADMPAGIYQISVQACQRPVATTYFGNSVLNKVYAQLLPDDVSVDDPASLFADGAYDNHVVFKQSVTGSLNVLAINNKSNPAEGDITLFTNIRLYYYGSEVTKDEVTSIEEIELTQERNAPTAIYDLMGRRVAAPTKGIYIMNGKKVVVK